MSLSSTLISCIAAESSAMPGICGGEEPVFGDAAIDMRVAGDGQLSSFTLRGDFQCSINSCCSMFMYFKLEGGI